jgi:APA family basic amino acid/polyamine antiporter
MYCSILGYLSIAIAEFVSTLIPLSAEAVRVAGASILLGIVLVQWLGVRVGSQFQEITTSLKCFAFLALIVACLVAPSHGHTSAGAISSITFGGLLMALQAIVITYGGWQSPLYFVEEDRDPARDLPRIMIGGVLLVIAVYVLVNLALLKILPMSELSGATLPAARAANIIAGTHGRDIITILSVISLVPALNAVVMMATRVLFAMARDRLFWSRSSIVNTGGTPWMAMLLTAAVSLGLIVTGTFQRLVAMTSFFLMANYSVCCLALIVLRCREPDLQRAYPAWGYPWSVWMVMVGGVIFVVGMLIGDAFNGLAAMGLLAVGFIGRLVFRRRATAR